MPASYICWNVFVRSHMHVLVIKCCFSDRNICYCDYVNASLSLAAIRPQRIFSSSSRMKLWFTPKNKEGKVKRQARERERGMFVCSRKYLSFKNVFSFHLKYKKGTRDVMRVRYSSREYVRRKERRKRRGMNVQNIIRGRVGEGKEKMK